MRKSKLNNVGKCERVANRGWPSTLPYSYFLFLKQMDIEEAEAVRSYFC